MTPPLTRQQVWGQRIKAARLDRGMTQRRFAREFGVSHATIDRWERGVAAPGDDYRIAIARSTGRDPDEMFSLKVGK